MTEKPPEPEKESKPKKSYKEVKESAGLLESDSDPDDNEVKLIMGFDPDVPVSLQAFNHVSGMIKEHEKRKKARDPETCCTPPLAEDTLWTNLDDDPFGVYTDLGGRSSPTTPPPLRAIKLTYNETAEKIIKALNEVKIEAHKHESTKEIELKEELASHDYAIKKFKNFKSGPVDPEWKPVRRDRPMMPHGHQRFASSLIMRPAIDRQPQRYLSPVKVQQRRPLLPQARHPGSRAQGPQHGPHGSSVKLRLPMMPKNGKRPIVELVLRTPEGRYQPIKFRNNSQITETIPRSLFNKANAARKTLYVKSQQLPRLNGKPVFLAINPGAPHQPLPAMARPPQTQNRPPPPPTGDQVSILVRPQKSAPSTKPVLLNVPRKVALKVKVGTTLSFSASNDQKYIVMDSKIHPPVGSKGAARNQNRPPPSPQQRPRLPPSLTVIPNPRPLVPSPNRRGAMVPSPNRRGAMMGGQPGRGRAASMVRMPRGGGRGSPAGRGSPGGVNRTLATLMNNKRPGLTITRGPAGPGGSPGPKPAKVPRMAPAVPKGANILASGEV